jgi:hypothetical protein
LLSLYQQRIQRSVERNMTELRTLRAERKAAREQAWKKPALLAQLAQRKGEKYDAAADFSPELLGTDTDFFGAAIALLIARNQRLKEGRDYAKTCVNPKSGIKCPQPRNSEGWGRRNRVRPTSQGETALPRLALCFRGATHRESGSQVRGLGLYGDFRSRPHYLSSR